MQKNTNFAPSQTLIAMNQVPFELKSLKQAVILIGIQASGKSTFCQRYLSDSFHIYISLDDVGTRNRELELLMRCIDSNRSFVIDNTNPEVSDRQRYISLAKQHGYETVGIFFQSKVRECIERNELREMKVPAKAIAATSNKLQLPSYEEGFDLLFFAQINEEGFDIKQWRK